MIETPPKLEFIHPTPLDQPKLGKGTKKGNGSPYLLSKTINAFYALAGILSFFTSYSLFL